MLEIEGTFKLMANSRDREETLIRLLRKQSLLSEDELKECLSYQEKAKSLGKAKPLSKIILQKELLSKTTLIHLLEKTENSEIELHTSPTPLKVNPQTPPLEKESTSSKKLKTSKNKLPSLEEKQPSPPLSTSLEKETKNPFSLEKSSPKSPEKLRLKPQTEKVPSSSSESEPRCEKLASEKLRLKPQTEKALKPIEKKSQTKRVSASKLVVSEENVEEKKQTKRVSASRLSLENVEEKKQTKRVSASKLTLSEDTLGEKKSQTKRVSASKLVVSEESNEKNERENASQEPLVVRETSLEKPKALKNTKREKKPSKKKKEQEEALNLEQEKETLSEKDSEKDLEKKAIKDSKKSSKETRKPSEELEDTVKVVKEAQEESKKGEVQKTETKRTFRGRNLKKSPSFFSKKSKAVQGKETPLQEEDVLAKKNSSVIAFISSHLQQSVEEENLKLGKTAILLFCCCLLLSVFLIVVVGIKYYSKTPKKAITSGSELDPSKKTDLPPPSNLTSFENEPLFKEVLALIQQEKYFKARERLMQQLSEGHNSQLYEQIERLLTQVDQKILQKHHFQAPLTWDSGQVQLHYDFLNQNYQDKKDFFYQDKMQYHLNSEGFALLDGEISHNARFMETLSVSLLFKNENTTQGIFYLKGLGYQLIYPVNGQGVLLQSKKQKIPLWSGNGPPLTEGELQWIVLPEEIRLEYQQEILFRVPISETQDSGVALRFLEGDPKKAFILKNLQLQSKFAVGWVEKTIPHYGEPKD